MGPTVDYLPADMDASLLKLFQNGSNLEMVEFYERLELIIFYDQ